ncbi:hypothetical protein FZEAL_868 [Fusarium zealandicum]|uniref:Rhodopsin domain-containing protein n=1 Tax=Fusarium zealandicum TaxID=1053134 RepID=A0A8H4UUH6_9HYPO|nr:hypothetical protein FZEAL_868 [Fusarium zealandicum]
MAIDPSITTVNPEGLGLVIFGVTIFFSVPSAIVIALRCWIRAKHGVFGLDDGLMTIGWAEVLFACVVGVVSRGTYAGIGTRDEFLNDNMQRDGRMYIWLFQTCYCCSLLFIKGSICINLLRIAVERTHRIILWVTLTASCISTLIVIIGLMAMCRPIAANWDKDAGQCSPPTVIVSLSYLVSAAAVATDWVCAILPGFMLYKTQMKTATKVSISIILGMGILASIATIVRLPYIQAYSKTDEYLHNVGNIVLWSVFESGTGLIAGSLPSLRRLLKNWVNFDSTHHAPTHPTPFTGTGRGTMISKAGKGVTTAMGTNRDWELMDDASSSRKIYVQVDVEMQSLERAGTSMMSRESQEEIRPRHEKEFGARPKISSR